MPLPKFKALNNENDADKLIDQLWDYYNDPKEAGTAQEKGAYIEKVIEDYIVSDLADGAANKRLREYLIGGHVLSDLDNGAKYNCGKAFWEGVTKSQIKEAADMAGLLDLAKKLSKAPKINDPKAVFKGYEKNEKTAKIFHECFDEIEKECASHQLDSDDGFYLRGAVSEYYRDRCMEKAHQEGKEKYINPRDNQEWTVSEDGIENLEQDRASTKLVIQAMKKANQKYPFLGLDEKIASLEKSYRSMSGCTLNPLPEDQQYAPVTTSAHAIYVSEKALDGLFRYIDKENHKRCDAINDIYKQTFLNGAGTKENTMYGWITESMTDKELDEFNQALEKVTDQRNYKNDFKLNNVKLKINETAPDYRKDANPEKIEDTPERKQIKAMGLPTADELRRQAEWADTWLKADKRISNAKSAYFDVIEKEINKKLENGKLKGENGQWTKYDNDKYHESYRKKNPLKLDEDLLKFKHRGVEYKTQAPQCKEKFYDFTSLETLAGVVKNTAKNITVPEEHKEAWEQVQKSAEKLSKQFRGLNFDDVTNEELLSMYQDVRKLNELFEVPVTVKGKKKPLYHVFKEQIKNVPYNSNVLSEEKILENYEKFLGVKPDMEKIKKAEWAIETQQAVQERDARIHAEEMEAQANQQNQDQIDDSQLGELVQEDQHKAVVDKLSPMLGDLGLKRHFFGGTKNKSLAHLKELTEQLVNGCNLDAIDNDHPLNNRQRVEKMLEVLKEANRLADRKPEAKRVVKAISELLKDPVNDKYMQQIVNEDEALEGQAEPSADESALERENREKSAQIAHDIIWDTQTALGAADMAVNSKAEFSAKKEAAEEAVAVIIAGKMYEDAMRKFGPGDKIPSDMDMMTDIKAHAEDIRKRSDFKRMMQDVVETKDLVELQKKAKNGNALLNELSKHTKALMQKDGVKAGHSTAKQRENAKEIKKL